MISIVNTGDEISCQPGLSLKLVYASQHSEKLDSDDCDGETASFSYVARMSSQSAMLLLRASCSE